MADEGMIERVAAAIAGAGAPAEPTWDDMRRTALVVVEEAFEWQPIETAPKDGTPILAYCRGMEREFHSLREFYGEDDDEYQTPPLFYGVVRWETNDVMGWWGGYYSGQDPFRAKEPSHWMPLPEPPK